MIHLMNLTFLVCPVNLSLHVSCKVQGFRVRHLNFSVTFKNNISLRFKVCLSTSGRHLVMDQHMKLKLKSQESHAPLY